MKNKIVSLVDMIKLSDNEELSEGYVRYICGIDAERQYKHQEIVDIQCLLNVIQISAENCEQKNEGRVKKRQFFHASFLLWVKHGHFN